MTLATGSKLGPYEILSSIGSGGMGEVYRARDTRLDRTVAIKILPDRFSNILILNSVLKEKPAPFPTSPIQTSAPSLISVTRMASTFSSWNFLKGKLLRIV
jgi:serine/threonine protein kinase